jgi:hypothetical protein
MATSCIHLLDYKKMLKRQNPPQTHQMELKQEQRLTKKEFEKLSAEIRELVGDKLKGHKDGDAERLLFEW